MKTNVTIHTLQSMKSHGERIAMITAYDATFARLCDESNIDILLVGDSVGMVIQGHDTTLPVTVDEIIYHARAVRRGTRRAHLVGDMPFMSYQASVDDAVANAGRLVKEGGVHSVKLEGGAKHAALVSRIVEAGIPVMGHLGLTPQSFHQMGGFKVQGRDLKAGQQLVEDALALQDAGAFAIVLEGIPSEVAHEITQQLEIPTIGIGAGPHCDGQVLVLHDLLGLTDNFKPRFVRRYAQLATRVRTAVDGFIKDVRDGSFPHDDESFFRDKATRPNAAAQPASVSAIAAAGGCAPGPAKTDVE